MKKFFKWIGIIIGAFILIPIIIMIFSAIFSTAPEQKSIELTPAQKDSIAAIELNDKIRGIEERIKYIKDYTWPANNLIAQYENNEIKANEMFKNKNVLISGSIEDIGADITGLPYLIVGNYNYASIQCMFPESMKRILSNVQKGQTYLIEGICKGKLMHIMFEDCKFSENENQLKKKLNELK